MEELLLVKGVTRALFSGRPEAPGLAEYLTVAGADQRVNVNTADDLVLRTLGYSQAEVSLLRGGRPYADPRRLPTQLQQRGAALRTTTDTFRIEAWGEVAGQRGPTLVTVVQRRLDLDRSARAVPLAWRWNDPPGAADTPAGSAGESR